MKACYNGFSIQMTLATAKMVSHPGLCDSDVQWVIARKPGHPNHVARPRACTPDVLAKELEEYTDWDVSDDTANWERMVWIAGGDIKEAHRTKVRR